MFKVNRLIVHSVEKSKGTLVTLKSNNLTGVKGSYYTALEKFVKSFSNDGIIHAVFQDGHESSFKQAFLDFQASEKLDTDFKTFSHTAIDSVENFIKSTNSPGGFFFFCEYENSDHTYLAVLLVRKTENMNIVFDKETMSYEITSMTIPDTQNIAMGCELDFTKFRAGQSYIKLTNKKNAELSEYFKNWVGVSKKGSSAEYTERLFTLLDSASNDSKIIPKSEFQSKLFSLLGTQVEKRADLQAISTQMFGDKMYLQSKAAELNIEIDSEFLLHKAEYRKHNFIESKEINGVKVKFPRHLYGTNGQIDIRESGGTRILVIEVPEIVDDILNKIKK